MEFLSLSRRRSSARNVPAAKSAEKRMVLQARVECVLETCFCCRYEASLFALEEVGVQVQIQLVDEMI